MAPDDGFSLEADTSAIVVANISNNTFTNHDGDDFNLSLINNAVVDLTFNNNDLNGGANKLSAGVFILGASFNGSLEYDISGNNVQGANQGGAIFVNKGSGTGDLQRPDRRQRDRRSCGAVVRRTAVQSAFMPARVARAARTRPSSTATRSTNTSIAASFWRPAKAAPRLVATVTNNTVSDFADAINSLHGIHFDFGILGTDNAQITIDVRNNLIANAGNEPQGGVDFRMRTAGRNDVFIAGYTAATTAANAQAFIDAQNPERHDVLGDRRPRPEPTTTVRRARSRLRTCRNCRLRRCSPRKAASRPHAPAAAQADDAPAVDATPPTGDITPSTGDDHASDRRDARPRRPAAAGAGRTPAIPSSSTTAC